MLESVGFWCDTTQRLQADGGYGGNLETWLLNQLQCQLEIAVQLKGTGFQILAKGQMVAQALARLGQYRGLSLDYEHKSLYWKNIIYIAMTSQLSGFN